MPPKTLPFARKKKSKEQPKKYKCPDCGHEEDSPEFNLDWDAHQCTACGGETHISQAYIEEPDTTPESVAPPAKTTLGKPRKKKAQEPQKLYKCAFCDAQQDHPSKNEYGQPTCDNCGEEIYLNRNYNGEPPAVEPAPTEDIDTRADEERAEPAEETTPEPEPVPVEDNAPKFRIQRKPRVEKLPVKLTDEERIAYGKEMADLLAEAEQIDRETKQFKKAQDSKLAGVEAKLSERSIAVSNGYEHRNVNCELVMDYELFEVYTVRLDTNEIVDRRKMSNDERQMQLTAE